MAYHKEASDPQLVCNFRVRQSWVWLFQGETPLSETKDIRGIVYQMTANEWEVLDEGNRRGQPRKGDRPRSPAILCRRLIWARPQVHCRDRSRPDRIAAASVMKPALNQFPECSTTGTLAAPNAAPALSSQLPSPISNLRGTT